MDLTAFVMHGDDEIKFSVFCFSVLKLKDLFIPAENMSRIPVIMKKTDQLIVFFFSAQSDCIFFKLHIIGIPCIRLFHRRSSSHPGQGQDSATESVSDI